MRNIESVIGISPTGASSFGRWLTLSCPSPAQEPRGEVGGGVRDRRRRRRPADPTELSQQDPDRKIQGYDVPPVQRDVQQGERHCRDADGRVVAGDGAYGVVQGPAQED